MSYTGGGSLSNDGNSTNGVIQGLNCRNVWHTAVTPSRSSISFYTRHRLLLDHPQFPEPLAFLVAARVDWEMVIRPDNRF